MRIGKIVPITEAEGPGRRTAVWFQGCSLSCDGCCNPEFLDAGGGSEMSVSQIFEEIPFKEVEGITLLGGEPVEQCSELLELLIRVRKTGLSIMLFSGKPWEILRSTPETKQIVELCDLVVAGPFLKKDTPDSRRWVGSKNQTIHFPGDRYKALAEDWPVNLYDLEIHIQDDELQLHGAPELIDLLLKPDISPVSVAKEREIQG